MYPDAAAADDDLSLLLALLPWSCSRHETRAGLSDKRRPVRNQCITFLVEDADEDEGGGILAEVVIDGCSIILFRFGDGWDDNDCTAFGWLIEIHRQAMATTTEIILMVIVAADNDNRNRTGDTMCIDWWWIQGKRINEQHNTARQGLSYIVMQTRGM